MTISRLLLATAAALMMNAAAIAAEPVLLPGGVQIEDIEPGTGAVAQPGQVVTVHYTGWLYVNDERGKSFDSSHGGAPFTFRLGAGEVIRGWDEGVAGMKVGGVRTLIIPPEAGYGAEGDGTIPPNSWLLFEVELLGVR
ncbi:FKBP-type peptidyl-prolyl cis-trans isomerase [Sphingomonadaceae bacterium G21617-S1]|nr:FKBP-type peptidyl-prolyl cis-trans isomerase [Sphingomonadaceae bacterium G21617-S1]